MKKIKTVRTTIHWLSFTYVLYIFSKASILKIIEADDMVQGMASFGFNRTWTILIGYGELLGVLGLLAGIWRNKLKNASALYLFPFSVGALMVHFSHKDYMDHYDALFSACALIVLLGTDKHFDIKL